MHSNNAVATFAGLAGSDDLEETRILMIGGCTLDTVQPLIKLQTAEVEIKASDVGLLVKFSLFSEYPVTTIKVGHFLLY